MLTSLFSTIHHHPASFHLIPSPWDWISWLVLSFGVVIGAVAWKSQKKQRVSEKSLETRTLKITGISLSILLVLLCVGDWIISRNAASKIIIQRMEQAASAVSESVPLFIKTGKSLITTLSHDPRLQAEAVETVDAELKNSMLLTDFFGELILVDKELRPLAIQPSGDIQDIHLLPDEVEAIEVSIQGESEPILVIASEGNEPTSLTFVGGVRDDAGQVIRVLIGRVDQSKNPFQLLVDQPLEKLADLNGKGLLIGELGGVLYPTPSDPPLFPYGGDTGGEPYATELVTGEGIQNLAYFHPMIQPAWVVVILVPTREIQPLALELTIPLAALMLIFALAAITIIWFSTRKVSRSLHNLAYEAERITQGHLDRPLSTAGEGEIGQLRVAFEQMRLSQRERLEELNQLLLVSQGVASSLEMKKVAQPVLEAVLTTGACAARLILVPLSRQLGDEMPLHFSQGPSKDKYVHLDEPILKAVKKKNELILSDAAQANSIGFPPDQPQPASLAAFSLRRDNNFYGVLWAAYDQHRTFSEEEIRFLSTLTGQAALAVVNARLFYSAEIGRQRLAAILASTPDPVLVTDYQDRLLLANPAAQQVLGAEIKPIEGQPASQSITQQKILELLLVSQEERSSEIKLPNGQTYYATARAVIAENQRMGRVCVLRDVTHFKELDALKSDFVSTVSHDLRSPLTLMRGYATMLDMVGNLNEQQHGYIGKIITAVEVMSRLVNRLLDLGRIEAGVGLEVEDVVLTEVAEAVRRSLELQAAEKSINLGVELAAGLPRSIQADPTLFQQAIFNLVENGIKYTPQKGSVTLRMKPRAEDLVVEVEDNGIGVPPADQPRLFEKFYRGTQREARKQRGSGLGLAIVRSIVEWHGGKVWLESQLGKGSTFFLSIPYTQKGNGKREPQPMVP